ncbi:MAG: hypothetical protein ACFFAS_16350 [Promethearchaeota archaeon]
MVEKCAYHSMKNHSTKKCEFCSKLICRECKKVYQLKHADGDDDVGGSWYIQHVVCTPCYYVNSIKDLKSMGKYCSIIIAALFLGGPIAIIVNSIINGLELFDTMIQVSTSLFFGVMFLSMVFIKLSRHQKRLKN